jgi:hypothetical protein
MDLLGPPVEAGGRTDQVAATLEGGAAGALRVFQVVDGGEMAVEEAGIGQRPQMLSGLEFRRVRWEEEQVDVVGHLQPGAGMPARAVEH